MKVREAIQRVQSLYSRGVQSDDSRLTDRHIFSKLVSVRNRIIAQEAKKKQKLSPWNYQVLNCVELIEVSAHDCPCYPPVGCNILRSKHPVPAILSGFEGGLIDMIGTIDRRTMFSFITLPQVPYITKGAKYAKNNTYYFFQEDYMYVITPTMIEVALITAIFEDPVLAFRFPSACIDYGVECKECQDIMDMNFPLDSSKEEALLEMTNLELINAMKQIPQDLDSDTVEGI